MAKVIYLTLEQVLAIHHEEIEKFGGSHGIRDLGLLESALQRPQASFMGVDLYATLFDKAAALIHSILLNHPFLDGNKRTATVSVARFLYVNEFKLTVIQNELVKFALEVEAKILDLEQIPKWLKEHSVKNPRC